MKVKNWPVFLSVCLALGAIGNIIVMCFLIGFGFHTYIGKMALYLAFALEILSLLVSAHSERRLSRSGKPHTPSKKMRHFRRISALIWLLGALLLLVSLVLSLAGIRFGSAWVQHPCIIGAILAPIGWAGLLMASHRHQEALRCINA